MSIFERNALDSALVDLASASTALERSARPNLKDVEEARDRAKKAHGILDAAHKLMSVGIYVVADAPASPGTPLPFDAPVPEPPDPTPQEILEAWEHWDEDEQTDEFSARLERLDERQEKSLRGDEQAFLAWETAWDIMRKDTFTRLLVAEDREPVSMVIPTDEERDTWTAANLQAPDPWAEFASWTPEAQDIAFDDLKSRLVDIGLESEMALADWKKHGKAWDASWKLDRLDTFKRLSWAIDGRPQAAWGIPSDEEMGIPEKAEVINEAL